MNVSEPVTLLRCAVVEDNPHIRASLVALLEDEGIEVVGSAATAEEAKALFGHSVDLLIADLNLGEASGIDVLHDAAEASPGTNGILYTASLTRGVAREALAAGARGVVRKQVPPSNLLRAIAVIAQGGVYVDDRTG